MHLLTDQVCPQLVGLNVLDGYPLDRFGKHLLATFADLNEQPEIREAAALAGVSLSDWLRERIIRAARREVAEAGRYQAAGKTGE